MFNLSPYLTGLACDDCGQLWSPGPALLTCPSCGGLLDAKYDLDVIRQVLDLDSILKRKADVWRWKEFLPVHDEADMVRIGSGGSPLIRCRRLAHWAGVKELWVKYEGMQPTASLKDRSFAVAVSTAKRMGVRQAITYSSGNAAISLAAHAAHAGLTCLILVNAWADPAKLGVLNQFSWPIVKIDWTDFTEVESLLAKAVEELGVYSFVNFQNPWRHEAYQTYAFENWIDLDRQAPDHEIHPIGTGGGIFGSWKGWNALRSVGYTSRLPHLHGTQPAVASAVATAFDAGLREATPGGDPRNTIAEAIANNIPLGKGKRPLKVAYESGGSIQAISEEAIMEALYKLGEEGICAEPAGSTTVAAARQMVQHGIIKSSEVVVCTVTASGYKQPYVATARPMPTIHPTIDELKKVLQRNG